MWAKNIYNFGDFSKTFDTVNHKILLMKLEHSNSIRRIANECFRSRYLDNRQQIVIVIMVHQQQSVAHCTSFAVHYQKIYFHLYQKLYQFSLALGYISLVLIELSIRIFEYVSIFNNVKWQTNARSDILSGNFVVIYIKIYFNNTNQQAIAFIDKRL